MIESFTNNKNRLFWTLQLGGWGGYALLNYLFGVEAMDRPADYFVPSLLYSQDGIAITTCS